MSFFAEITASGSGATTTTPGAAGVFITFIAWDGNGLGTPCFTMDALGTHSIKRVTPSVGVSGIDTSDVGVPWLCRLSLHISVTANSADTLNFVFAKNGTPLSPGVTITVPNGLYGFSFSASHELHASLADGDLVTVMVTSNTTPGNIVKATGSFSVTRDVS